MVGGFLPTSIESSARWSTALGHLQRSMCGSAPTDSIVRQLFALIARCHQIVGDLAAALRSVPGAYGSTPMTPSCISALENGPRRVPGRRRGHGARRSSAVK